MKRTFGAIANLVGDHRHNSELKTRTLLKFGVVLAAFVVLFSVIFQVLMAREGQEHDWLVGVPGWRPSSRPGSAHG